jgi:cyclic beta-1,2-glucan synthetase
MLAVQQLPRLEESLLRPDADAEEQARVAAWLVDLRGALERSQIWADRIERRCESLILRIGTLFDNMGFGFLFDKRRSLFSIGYSVTRQEMDGSHYDLLASEARLTSFLAIARGDVGEEHWFRLGRPITSIAGRRALLSWSGTMFEYLMPPLTMRTYEHSLLSHTYRTVVRKQRQYGAQRGVPWGISESGYARVDRDLNHQYRAFGVPGLSLRRGAGLDLVVSPYSTLLALAVEPRAAVRNLRRLKKEGIEGPYGFYEAVDYTTRRLPEGQNKLIVRSYMAHHQGMGLVALANRLQEDLMVRRFHTAPMVRANALLLQERVPGRVALRHLFWQKGVTSLRARRRPTPPAARRPVSIHTRTPSAHFLSNGAYTTMVTNAGGGYSAWNGKSVTRWRGDATRDHWGTFIYVRDLDRAVVWSAGFQPTTHEPEQYEATFLESQVLLQRRDYGIETQTEIAVSTEDNVEVRRITLTNNTRETRRLDLTSYAEIVLAPPSEDLDHPAFGNLHIETELLPDLDALLCRRRPRSAQEAPIWAVHVLGVEGWVSHTCEAETDRARFLGRGRTPAAPAALAPGTHLSNTVGAVLDPVISLRQPVALEPGGSAQVSFSTGVAGSRDEAIALAAKYHDPQAVARALAFSHTRSRLERRYMGLSAEQALLFQRLASRVLFSDPSLQADPALKALNTKGQSALWPYGISGDLPIVLLRVGESEDVDLARQLLLAHEYWQARGLSTDLVILNQHPLGYSHGLRDKLVEAIRSHQSQLRWDKPGGVLLLHADRLKEEDHVLLSTVARAVVVGGRGTLAEQLDRPVPEPDLPGRKGFALQPSAEPPAPVERPSLEFFNGLGCFRADSTEYVIALEDGQWTPMPWINVVANPEFGFLVSESGSGHTWSGNSRERRLTPWANDPVSDPPGEALYLRDEETGEYWTPTPLPIRESSPYLIRHGQGYTVFEHTSHGLEQELLMFVPMDESVKVCRLRIRNLSDRQRQVSATRYVSWVLGVTREQEWPHVVTEVDPTTGAVLARNTYGEDFAHRVAFADVNRIDREFTADRTEFIGRNGSLARPSALSRTGLGSQVGAGLDQCAAIRVTLELEPGEEDEIVFLLGEAQDLDEAHSLIQRYRQPNRIQDALEKVCSFWNTLLGSVQVRTPDESLNAMLNRWLPYQTLACRVWGRSALYQSGGAYGFRDQLQDVMALVYAAPGLTREQILRAAARQFEEGDVQHWWHPPSGRGVRTRFSDDLLWLPFVTAHYLRVTGDDDVLDEVVPYLQAPELEPGQESSYGLPKASDQEGTLYEHCTRAIERALRFGRHGLPLMGTGDWNDGMNLVGVGGQGESVWLAWFLHAVLTQFADICESRDDDSLAKQYRRQAAELGKAIEEQAWDGKWYRRAYYDDGTPLGSIQSDEAQIDSIAQSWSVISGAADLARARQAMGAVQERLIWEEEGLMPLFTPPFDKTELDPGYIKGYLPGVRENGGQYTHAALWNVLAFAALGDGDRAMKLLHMLNPINHARTREEVERYRVEPYVVTADVYTAPGHVGRGGWSWYTGAAGWMYRVGLESILGFQPRGDSLTFDPCIPRGWPQFEVSYRYGDTVYHITVENPEGINRGVRSVKLEEEDLPSKQLPLDGSGGTRYVRVLLGA